MAATLAAAGAAVAINYHSDDEAADEVARRIAIGGRRAITVRADVSRGEDVGLVYCYRHDDGLPETEGAFTTCIFWYAECLVQAGRMDEARLVLDKGLAYANPFGLFAKEADVRGQPIGNFPQGLTHLAFISAAFLIDRCLHPAFRPHWQP